MHYIEIVFIDDYFGNETILYKGSLAEIRLQMDADPEDITLARETVHNGEIEVRAYEEVTLC